MRTPRFTMSCNCTIGHGGHQRIIEGIVLSKRGNFQIPQHAREAQIDHEMIRRTLVFALVVQRGDVDALVGQVDLQQARQVSVDHPDIEVRVVPNDRSAPDEVQEVRQDLASVVRSEGPRPRSGGP